MKKSLMPTITLSLLLSGAFAPPASTQTPGTTPATVRQQPATEKSDAPRPGSRAEQFRVRAEALENQIVRLEAEHQSAIDELKAVHALAQKENADQTARRLEMLIAKGRQKFQARIQARTQELELLRERARLDPDRLGDLRRKQARGQTLSDAERAYLDRAGEILAAQDAKRRPPPRQRPAEPAQPRRAGDEKPPPTFSNVHYGEHERQVLDFWKADSENPTPLVIYIHGGGFVGGDKRSVQSIVISECLNSGISVAAIHYRFVTTDIFPAPQLDGARAVQFLRYKAKQWNIDPNRIAAYGGSAGAGISMFVGFHDDMADPAAGDPVARQSTRLAAIGSFGGQSSYDPAVIRQWIGGRAHEHPSMFKCYGVRSFDEIEARGLQKVCDLVSAIKHVSKDDPPIFMFYTEPDRDLPPDARPGLGIHHPRFAHRLKKALDAAGVRSVYYHSSSFRQNPHLEMVRFFKSRFGI